MQLAYSCLLLAGLMPYLWVGYAKFTGRGYDNHAPRDFLAKLDGARARANWAHQNAFEAFPFFAVGVIVCQLAGVSVGTINALALAFVLLRTLYGICYIRDWATLRSLCWMLALACVIALYGFAISQA